ncbi:hypothetical protein AAMO2058_000150800 [Amorphochlora amoebiformis]
MAPGWLALLLMGTVTALRDTTNDEQSRTLMAADTTNSSMKPEERSHNEFINTIKSMGEVLKFGRPMPSQGEEGNSPSIVESLKDSATSGRLFTSLKLLAGVCMVFFILYTFKIEQASVKTLIGFGSGRRVVDESRQESKT